LGVLFNAPTPSTTPKEDSTIQGLSTFFFTTVATYQKKTTDTLGPGGIAGITVGVVVLIAVVLGVVFGVKSIRNKVMPYSQRKDDRLPEARRAAEEPSSSSEESTPGKPNSWKKGTTDTLVAK